MFHTENPWLRNEEGVINSKWYIFFSNGIISEIKSSISYINDCHIHYSYTMYIRCTVCGTVMSLIAIKAKVST